MKMYPHSKN